jgi:hypothetical protein
MSGVMTRATGVKLARLQQWWAAGYIGPPSIRVAQGAGTRNVFSLLDLFFIMFFRRSIESGIPREDIKKLLLNINKVDDSFSQSLETYLEMFKREGAHTLPSPRVIETYAVFFRQGNEVIKFEILTSENGKLALPEDISSADDFIGINIGKIIDELIKNIAG